MALLMIEEHVDKLLAYYQAQLPAKCTSLNAEYNDGIRIDPPKTGAYHPGELQLVDNIDYPKLFVMGRSSEVNHYTSASTTAVHTMEVIVALKHVNTATLQRQMYRYGRALWELTTARFFASTGDDYFILHGDGDITIDFEAPDAQNTTAPYIGKTVLRFTGEKQESN